jgi:hypothetical protein
MEMGPDMVLNWIDFKFFMEMLRMKGFRNSNNQFQNWTRSSSKIKKRVRTRWKVPFEIKN